jgi:hypothetical protein
VLLTIHCPVGVNQWWREEEFEHRSVAQGTRHGLREAAWPSPCH